MGKNGTHTSAGGKAPEAVGDILCKLCIGHFDENIIGSAYAELFKVRVICKGSGEIDLCAHNYFGDMGYPLGGKV